MRVRETLKKEIEGRIDGMNDYMRIDYLSSCLGNQLDFDTRKFVLVKLSGLFETKKMFLDSARMMRSAAEINTNVQNKINDFVKSVELFVKGGDFDRADISMKKAMQLSDKKQGEEIWKSVREFYRTQGRACLEKNKRNHAALVYEKFLSFDLNEVEKEEIQEKLLELYEEIGEMSKVRSLKGRIKK